MNVQKTGRLLTALLGMATISMTAAQAAAPQTAAKPAPAPTKAAVPAVTVKLGDAMLEEYHGGNPASRTTILRSGDVVRNTKPAESGKKHS